MKGIKKAIEEFTQSLPQSTVEKCPYLPGKAWITRLFITYHIDPAVYENLLAYGYRRSGYIIYKNQCPGCTACTPIRTDTENFTPTKSQKRTIKKNNDIKIIISDLNFDEQIFKLYKKYIADKHNNHKTNTQEFISFLCESPLETKIMRYYLGKKLIGAGFIDILPDGISSVYFAYDPAEKKRSLGTYSMIKEIEYSRHLGKKWLYSGFYIAETSKMSYKARFTPAQIAKDGIWKNK
ncbi:arginyltransferase [Spirochaetia bacterium 38H-sp]|uniref:Aspartate/glutamate leucyltransferase n=1 Tax=Rarispira pelagica TaxID=3141764 RepID=A0ABU9UDL2_9SPIR